MPVEVLSSIPEVAKLGPLFRSSDKPQDLTESETEYVVKCVKHAFANHIVFQVCVHACSSTVLCVLLCVMSLCVCVCSHWLVYPSPSLLPPSRQFDVFNTLEDQLLSNVRVEVEEPEGFKVVGCIPIESLPYNKPGTTYTIVELAEPDTGEIDEEWDKREGVTGWLHGLHLFMCVVQQCMSLNPLLPLCTTLCSVKKSVTSSRLLQLDTVYLLGRRRRPYIVFRFRSSYGFMFVYIYIYIFLSFCKWRRSRRSLQSFKSSLMTFRRV